MNKDLSGFIDCRQRLVDPPPYGTICCGMRVLIDYRPALRRPTGVGAFVHHLVSALADLEAEAAPAREALELTVFSASWKDRLKDAGRRLPAAVRTIDRRIPVRLLNLAWHRAGWPAVEALTGRRFDVVHSPHPLLMPSRAAAQVITVHDLDFLDHPDRTTGEIHRDYAALVRRHVARAAHVVVPSRHTASELGRRLHVPPEAISVCPNGAPEWPARDRPPSPGHLLFVGTLEPRKNVAGLLDAYARLVTRRPDIPVLVLAGADRTGPHGSEDWRQRLERPPLAGRVRRTGYIESPALQALYVGARALVLPSLDEGFGLPALEAMTVGVPVVASNRGGLPEVVGNAGLLVDPTDCDALAAALERVSTDDALARQCVARGLQRARAFTWRASARSLRCAYRKAIEARARRTGAAA